MKRRFLAGSITRFKVALAILAVLSLHGASSADAGGKKTACKISARFKLPRWYHEGLYFDGKDIWVNNGEKGKTWVVDPSNGAIVRELEPAGTFTEAVTSRENGKYIVTDWDSKKIYTARIENSRMEPEDEVSVAPAHPAGAIWNGTSLFVITWTRGPAGTKFHLLKMDDKFNILSSRAITNISEPSQLAWDGKNLWVSSWYTRSIYMIDERTLEILGTIHSPAKKTTGIVWVGRYLWVTGTYSDLYKMEFKN
jgi:DNA-binding beta-propeller fold protein YncE